MNFIITEKENFQETHPYTKLIEGKALIYPIFDASVYSETGCVFQSRLNSQQ
jgi:hypothetical protein